MTTKPTPRSPRRIDRPALLRWWWRRRQGRRPAPASNGAQPGAVKLAATAAGPNAKASSGVISAEGEIAIKGVPGFEDPFSNTVSGPFQYRKGAALPDYELELGVRDYGVTLTSVNGRSYVTIGTTAYELPASVRQRLIRTSRRGRNGLTRTLEQFGIAPWRWETEQRIAGAEAIDGVPTTHIATSFNAGRILRDANTLLGLMRSLGLTRVVGLPPAIAPATRRVFVRGVTTKVGGSWIGVATRCCARPASRCASPSRRPIARSSAASRAASVVGKLQRDRGRRAAEDRGAGERRLVRGLPARDRRARRRAGSARVERARAALVSNSRFVSRVGYGCACNERNPRMPKLLLVPLDDTVIFPTMDINLPLDVSGEERVLLVPRHNGEYAKVGTIAKVGETIRLPGGARGASLESLHRGAIVGSAEASAAGLRAEVEEHPDPKPVDKRTRELEREYRAVVEEILAERGADERVARVPALRRRSRPAGRHGRLQPRPQHRAEDQAARDARRHRAPRARPGVPARAADRAAGAPPHPRRRRVRRPEAAARVLPAPADGVDPPRAGRGQRLGHRRVPHEDRRRRHAGRRARAGRARARPPRAHGRAERRVLDDPHLPRLAHLRAVEQALRRGARPGPRARGARRRPRGPGGRQGPHHRVHRRAQAARRSAASRWTARPARSSP